jgi:MFS family permease
MDLGLLRAAWSGPQLLFGVVAGVGVDRLRRRPLLIVSDLGRAVALAAIPAAVLWGGLRMWLLLLVSFVVGSFGTVFSVAYQSFLPSVVPRKSLVEGNSKLQTTAAVAQVAGPGLGGALVQLFTAPLVILIDSVSFLISAILLATMRVDEALPASSRGTTRRHGILHELSVGWKQLYKHPLLRAISGSSAILAFFFGVQQTVFVLYLVQALHLEAFMIGAILAVGSIGGIVGAMVAGVLSSRHLGSTLIVALLVNAIGAVLLGLASGVAAIAVLIVGQVLIGVSFPLYFINQTSLRQAIAPPEYLGRITAAFAMTSWGIVPVGALVGGVVPSLVGLQATLVIGGVGKLFAVGWLLFSPVRRFQHIPAIE